MWYRRVSHAFFLLPFLDFGLKAYYIKQGLSRIGVTFWSGTRGWHHSGGLKTHEWEFTCELCECSEMFALHMRRARA
jgi:hypothetical protein